VVALRWSGATTTSVNIYRNGTIVTTTANDGAWSQVLSSRGTYRYRLCDSGSTTRCSAEISITV
jgi:hypothetical protein